jgi:N-acetylglutamate synthase/N-acetylornithine aminotransferase
MISCKDVSKLLLRGELENQPWHKRVEVRMHLAMCGMCSRLAKQIRQMGDGARQMIGKTDADGDFEQKLLKRLAGE